MILSYRTSLARGKIRLAPTVLSWAGGDFTPVIGPSRSAAGNSSVNGNPKALPTCQVVEWQNIRPECDIAGVSIMILIPSMPDLSDLPLVLRIQTCRIRAETKIESCDSETAEILASFSGTDSERVPDRLIWGGNYALRNVYSKE